METDDIKPARWRPILKERWSRDGEMEVRPRRALEAFWRWEQTWERLTRDMMWTIRRADQRTWREREEKGERESGGGGWRVPG